MTPVVAFRVMPFGSEGAADQVVTGDPVLVGASDGIADPATTETAAGLYNTAGATTVHVTFVLAVSWFDVSVTVSEPAFEAV